MERWIKHYSSGHAILLVGEGDFSFSLSLAMAFGSAANIVATSLDSYEGLICKYKTNGIANVAKLRVLGATLLHGVDATQMESLPELRWRRFHRIIYSFPHAGFHGKEDNPDMIMMHRDLVHGFLRNASSMLSFDGEIHINHKITPPFDRWRIEDLGLEFSLLCIEQHEFKSEDYPLYRNKRGAGTRANEPFPLGACRTFKFKRSSEQNPNKRRKLDLMLSSPPANSSSIQRQALHNYTNEDCLGKLSGQIGACTGTRDDVYRLVEESFKTRLRYIQGHSVGSRFAGFPGPRMNSQYELNNCM